MFLLERLESQIATGTGVPATRKVLVDKDAVLELIDQLRVAIPEEIHAAKRINAEGERIIEKAHDEVDADHRRAQEQATYLIGERGLTEAAAGRGPADRRRGREAADGVRASAPTTTRPRVLLGPRERGRKALAGIEKGIERPRGPAGRAPRRADGPVDGRPNAADDGRGGDLPARGGRGPDRSAR